MIVVNPTGMAGTVGGIVLAWFVKIDLQFIHNFDNQIDVLILDKIRKFDSMLSVVYACPYKMKKHVSCIYFNDLARTV